MPLLLKRLRERHGSVNAYLHAYLHAYLLDTGPAPSATEALRARYL